MQSALFGLCFVLFIFVMMPLSVLGHELGHALAMLRFHSNGKPIIICIGCKMTLDPKTGKYYRPTSAWTMRWPRLLLIVSLSTKAASFGITYGQEKLNPLQRFRMILAGPLASLGLALLWSAGAWVLFYTGNSSQNALWHQIEPPVFLLCCLVAGYNALFFLLSILPIPNGKSKLFPSQKALVRAAGTDGYQLLRLYREGRLSENA